MPVDLPRVTRVYQNHHLDSTRWEVYKPRCGDIIVTTSYKSGTTWMQQILSSLLAGHSGKSFDLHGSAPWVDARFEGISKDDLLRVRGQVFSNLHGWTLKELGSRLGGLDYVSVHMAIRRLEAKLHRNAALKRRLERFHARLKK